MNLKVYTIPEIIYIFSRSQNLLYMKKRNYFLMRKKYQKSVKKYYDIEMNRKEEDAKAIEELREKKSNNLRMLLIRKIKENQNFFMTNRKLLFFIKRR